MLNASQSLLRPDQYRFGIKSPVLLYSSDYSEPHNSITDLRFLDSDFSITQALQLQLETAICYQHYFCNTDLRITTKIE